MRNIKKTWAMMLVVAMLVTSVVPAFAETTTYKYSAEATKLNNLGLYYGTGNMGDDFNPALGSMLDRQSGVVVLLRLFGLEKAASELPAAEVEKILKDKFSDEADIATWARNHVAYGVKMKLIDGTTKETPTTFRPLSSLNALAYAKLILAQLGVSYTYETAPADLYAAGGLSSAESIRYTASGTAAITRDDLVGISFGTLQAKDKDGMKVIANLVNSNFVDKAKAMAENVVTEEDLKAPVSKDAAKAMTEVKLTGDKSMVAKFDGMVPEEAKFEVTGPMTLNPTVTWNEARNEATITNSATFLDGSYTVKVVGANVESGKDTATVIAAANGIAKIEILGDQLIRTSGDTENGKGFFYVKLTDTYGNDVTKSRAYDVTISFSKKVESELSIDADTGKVEVELDNDGVAPVTDDERWDNYPAVPEMVTVTLYSNTVTGGAIASASKSLTVSEQSRVKDIKLGAVTYPGSASQILTDKDPAAYIELSALDQFGFEVTDEDKLTDDGATTEIIYSISDSDLTVTPETYNDANGIEKVRLIVATTSMTESKKVSLSAISKFKGIISNQLFLDVRVPKSVEKITLGNPEKIMAVGDTYDEVLVMPITAVDTDGRTLSVDEVISAYNASNINPTISGHSTIKVEVASSGEYKGKLISTLNSTADSIVGTIDVSQATLVVELPESNTSRTVTKLLSIRDRAYPVAVETDDTPAARLLANANTKFNFKFIDQYGRVMDSDMLDYEPVAGAAANDHPTAVKLTATFPSSSDATFTLKTNTDVDGAGAVDTDTNTTLNTTTTTAIVEASELDVDDAVTLTAGAQDGTVRLKAELYKEYKMDSVVNSLTKSFTIVDGLPSDLTYTIEDVPTLYAFDEAAQMDVGGAGTKPGEVDSSEFQALTSAEAARVRQVKLVAKDASGNTYAVPLANVLNASSSDTDVAHVIKVVGTGSAIDKHDDTVVVYGTDKAFDAENLPSSATKTATITLTVATDDGAKAVTKVVTVSNEEPKTSKVLITDAAQLATDPYSVEGDEITDLAGSVSVLNAKPIYVLELDQFGVYTQLAAGFDLTIVNTNRYANATTITTSANTIAGLNVGKIVKDEKVFLMHTAASGVKGQFSVTSSDGTTALDVTAPVLSSVALANVGATPTLTVGDTIALTFNESMTTTGNGTFTMTNGVVTLLGGTTFTFATPGVNVGNGTVAIVGSVATLTFTVVTTATSNPSGLVTPGGTLSGLKDLAGNSTAVTPSSAATGTF